MKKVSFFTVGCKLNQYETQAISEGLENIGFKRVNFGEEADLYLVNTCTVTAQSDYSSRQAIYRAKRFSPKAKIVIVGCYAQIDAENLRELPGVSLIIKNDNKDEILKRIARLFDGDSQLQNGILALSQVKISGHKNHTRGLVKIQDGCNQNCSYCIVPKARGGERSREVNSVLSEIENLQKNGFLEVVLTGVHIGRYNYQGKNLCQLLKKILEQTKIKRLRLSSIEPAEVTDKLINLISKEKRICKHFHIPLQSGDDEILSKMNRDYTTKEYEILAQKIVEAVPDVLVGADVMVGFPGESDRNFQNSLNFVSSCPINYLHVFSYSDRKGTVASNFSDKIPPQVIKQRNRQLRELGYRKWNSFIEGFVGKRLEVLIEKRRDKKTGKLIGLSDNYIRVLVEEGDGWMGRMVEVEVEGRKGKVLVGEIVD